MGVAGQAVDVAVLLPAPAGRWSGVEPGPDATATTPAAVVTTPDATVPTTEPTQTPTVEPTPSVTPTPTATPTPTPTPTATPTPSATTTPTPTPTQATPSPSPTTAWTTPPTVTTTELPVALVALALVVLVAAAAFVVLLQRRMRRSGGPGETVAAAGAAPPAGGAPGGDHDVAAPATATGNLAVAEVLAGVAALDAAAAVRAELEKTASPHETVQFCLRLGEAMIDTTAPVVQVQDTLEHVARANGVDDVEVVALPTALLLSTPQAPRARTVAVSAGYRSLRLDQVQEVLEVADLARVGAVRPADGLRRITAALDGPAPYGRWLQLLGYVLSAAGLALVLGGTLTDVALAAVLAAGVVVLERATSGWSDGPFHAIVVMVASFGVSTAVFALARTGLDVTLLPALAAPLITFLPGALLTTGVIDLATRQMIAGAARLAAGVMMLVLLALGIIAAGNLVGIPSRLAPAGQSLGWLGAWAGVLVFGVGATLRYCAQRRAVPWILLVLVVAYAGQLVGGALLGSQMSAFVGALVMTPVALLVARFADGPPAMVSFLPAFWLLVPGALGLVGVTTVLGESADQGIAAVVTAGTTMVAISLGVLTGLGAGSWALADGRRWSRPR